MTPEQLAEIKARRARITKGEWWIYEGDMVSVGCTKPGGQDYDVAGTHHPNDAAFIAHAPSDIDRLIAEIERITQERDKLQALNVHLQDQLINADRLFSSLKGISQRLNNTD